jgi:hypothetical protein
MNHRAPTDPTLVHLSRRLFSLPAREFGELLTAQLFLLGALWTVRRRPKGTLLRPVEEGPQAANRAGEDRLARLVVAVDRAARYGLFRPTCLVRAVALERMIVRAGVGPAVVRVGVLRGGDDFMAHAWIELAGRIIGDEPARVARFTPLHDFSALPR